MRKVIRYDKDGVHVAGAINVATNEGDETTRVSSRQKVRIVQKDGETVVSEEWSDDQVGEGGEPRRDR